MKVILTQDVPEIGPAGKVLSVAPGYARNYLYPHRLAVEATDGNMRQHEQVRQQAIEIMEQERVAAAELAQRIATFQLRFTLKADEHGHLYGSVSQADIVKALAELDVEVERRRIMMKDHIKSVGAHMIDVRLHGEVTGRVRIIVDAEEPPEGEKPPKKETDEAEAKDTEETDEKSEPADESDTPAEEEPADEPS